MAKAPKQISILCEDTLAELPELVALAEKGHQVFTFTKFRTCTLLSVTGSMMDLSDFDLILSKQACMYQEGMEKYLPEMVKGARARRYGNKSLQEELFND